MTVRVRECALADASEECVAAYEKFSEEQGWFHGYWNHRFSSDTWEAWKASWKACHIRIIDLGLVS